MKSTVVSSADKHNYYKLGGGGGVYKSIAET